MSTRNLIVHCAYALEAPMDGVRFDQLSRAINRRRGVRLLAGLGLGTLIPSAVDARCRNGKEKCGGTCYSPCPANQIRNPDTCKCRCVAPPKCGDKCYPKCPKTQIRDPHTCKCRCLATERECSDRSCVAKGTCCALPFESPCAAAPTGCCNAFAAEFCTPIDGCCEPLVEPVLDCNGHCCPVATRYCCTSAAAPNGTCVALNTGC